MRREISRADFVADMAKQASKRPPGYVSELEAIAIYADADKLVFDESGEDWRELAFKYCRYGLEPWHCDRLDICETCEHNGAGCNGCKIGGHACRAAQRCPAEPPKWLPLDILRTPTNGQAIH